MKDNVEKVVLFANGEFPAPEQVIKRLDNQDILIAVDGGLRHMTHHNLKPDLVIGDLDSANEDDIRRLCVQGVEIREYPIEKDETDLEIALLAACEMDPTVIWVIAALGGRIDQTLANIFLLTRPEFDGFDIRLIDGVQELFVIRTSTTINGNNGDRVSLLPVNGPASGIQTKGLKFPLQDGTLFPEKTRGISNQMTASNASVSLKSGLLICVHETTETNERSS